MNRRRALLLVAVLSIAWGLAVLVTGGFVIDTPWRPISSRTPSRPLVAGFLLLLWYLVRERDFWRSDLAPLATSKAARIVAGVAAAVPIVVGVGWGTFYATGSDASGYVSQAALLAHGHLTTRVPLWAEEARWNDAAFTSAPLGYRPTETSIILAPTYPPGLPLLMAVAYRITGPDSVFYVVPLLGAVMAIATYRLGRRFGGGWTGAVAAALAVSSPVFLMMVIEPMSDVAVTAFWTLALVCALRDTTAGAVLAGAASAMAVLIRPNLVPLAAVVGWIVVLGPAARVGRAIRFAAMLVPAVAVIASLNWYYYASPLHSGYGTIDYLYSTRTVGVNFGDYVSWLSRAQTPLIALAFLAPLLRPSGLDRRRAALVTVAFPLSVLALYLPYTAFREWVYVRFLLPAVPPLLVGLAIVATHAPAGRAARHVARASGGAIVAIVLGYSWIYATNYGVFRLKTSHGRYVRAVEFAKSLPAKSVLASVQHSGTLHYYTGRDVLRWDGLGSKDLDRAISYLENRGHVVYLFAEPHEVEMFTRQFAGACTVAAMGHADRIDLGGVAVYRLGACTSSSATDQ